MFAAASQSAGRLMVAIPAAASFVVVTTTTSYHRNNNNNSSGRVVDCETHAGITTDRLSAAVNLQRRMTPMGRFALKSETIENPSIPTFFIALAGGTPKQLPLMPYSSIQRLRQEITKPGMNFSEFELMWNERNFFSKHDRFQSKIAITTKNNKDDFFEPSSEYLNNYVKETLHYSSSSYRRHELKRQIEHYLTAPLDLNNRLWEAQISSGTLGSSGAISTAKVRDIRFNSTDTATNNDETVILFRAHHALADGVSLGAAISDLSDEAEQIRESIHHHVHLMKKANKKTTWFKRFLRSLRKLIGFWIIGSIRALTDHFYLLLVSNNPFDEIIRIQQQQQQQTNTRDNNRSVSWCDAAPVDQVKQLACCITPNATLNDVFVACVSYAVMRQLEEHNKNTSTATGGKSVVVPKYINVVIPVHFTGGVLLPGESMGNRIGAMVARIPARLLGKEEGVDRLKLTSQALTAVKNTPAACISYLGAKFCSSYLPDIWTKTMFRHNNCNAAVVVSNVRGPPHMLHWNGRDVVSMAGFLPLPPGIPIGIVVQSYNGMVSLTVTADRTAVPDADRFLSWVLEEYQRMCKEMNV